jgi:hypothetical protein
LPPEPSAESETLYDPKLVYVCDGEVRVEVVPSPKFQVYEEELEDVLVK